MIYPENRIVLGVAPTRRDDAIFPFEECMARKNAVMNRLDDLGIEYVNLDECCPKGGILSSLSDMEAARNYFKKANIDALFVPNVAYGSEGPIALLASAFKLPILIWGPPDPLGTGAGGKAQLGLYTIGKALRRMRIPFSFMGSYTVDSEGFRKGIKTFVAACNVVKEFRRAKILQVGPRPESFWNVIIDEGQLLEKFNIPVFPISMPEIFDEYNNVLEHERDKVDEIANIFRARTNMKVADIIAVKSAAMNIALEHLAEETRSTAIAVQCWHSMPRNLGIWPCAAGSLLNERGVCVACEGDIHGAISMIISQAATMGKKAPVFVDFDFEHPNNPNAFNVHHCAMAPISVYDEKPDMFKRGSPAGTEWGGCISGQFPPHGDASVMRFDGDNGEYSILLAKAKGVEGPAARTGRSYGWFEVEYWPELERKLTTGPYTHHGVVIYDNVLPPIYEALKYIPGINSDFAFKDEQEEAETYLYRR